MLNVANTKKEIKQESGQVLNTFYQKMCKVAFIGTVSNIFIFTQINWNTDCLTFADTEI